MPTDPPRPVWYLSVGGRPVPAAGKRPPADATWFASEGDHEWTRFGLPAPAAADGPARTASEAR